MSGTGFTIEVSADTSDAERKLGELAKRSENVEPALHQIGGMLVSHTLLRFEDQESPDGAPWLPSWRAQVQGGRTLVDSERLMGSLTYLISSDTLEVGTNTFYAAIHQFGGEIRPKAAPYLVFKAPGGGVRKVKQVTIPARPFIGFSQDDEADTLHIIGEYLMGGFSANEA